MAINIPDRIFNLFNEYVDLIQREIVLYYPEKRTECPNCYMSSIGGRSRSVSVYKPGGPIVFVDGQPCPYCGGQGFISSTVAETINARIYLEPEKWAKQMSIALPVGSIMTISDMETATKIRQADYMRPLYNNLESHVTDNYYRVGDVYSNSFKLNPQKYVTVFWSKTRNE